MAAQDIVVEAHQLRKRYGDGAGVRAALDGVSFEVRRGEFVAVLGPSGCGKSTLLAIIGCLDRTFEGSLKLFGENTKVMTDVDQAVMRGRRVGFVFQAFHLLGHLCARDNVLAPTLFVRGGLTLPRRQALHHRAEQLLSDVGLQGRGDDYPTTMSGGERQRLAIARALLMEPELLLCDEPTGNLDLETGQQIVRIFERLHDEGLTIVAVTHEEQLAGAAERVVRLQAGKVVGQTEQAGAQAASSHEAGAMVEAVSYPGEPLEGGP